jgi:hemolysin D
MNMVKTIWKKLFGEDTSKPLIKADPVAVSYRNVAAAIEDEPAPRLARGLFFIVVALIIIALVWATFARIDRVVVGQGRLVTLAPSIILQPFESSIITAVNVRIGQTVKKGESLVEFDPTFGVAQAAEARSRLSKLDAENARITAELSGSDYVSGSSLAELEQREIFLSKRAELTARIGSIDASIRRLRLESSAARDAQGIYSERIRRIRGIEAARTELAAQGLLAKVGVYQATSERLELELQHSEKRSTVSQTAQEIGRLSQERAAAIATVRKEASERQALLSNEIATLRNELGVADRRAQLVRLEAPTDAMIVNMGTASVGSIAEAGRPLLTLVPLNVPLEGEASFAPSDIARIRLGDRVRIKLAPFPFQRHGIVEGSVLALAEEAVLSKPDDPRSLVYKARIKVEKAQLRDVPADFRLYAGMPLTAEVVIGRRSVMSFLISPLIRTTDEAMREP